MLPARARRFFQPPDDRTLAWRLFWTGFLLRVLYLTLAHTFRLRPIDDHFQFGWEMGRIGRALATGFGYADPFTGHTGPTAWTPPLYPLLIAAVFRLFGIYTLASAWVLLTLNSLFSAATAPLVYSLALRTFAQATPHRDARTPDARSLALWSAWLWALYPAALQYAVRWVWDMCLTTLLFTAALLLALRIRQTATAAELKDNRHTPDNTASETTNAANSNNAPTNTHTNATRDWTLFGLLWGLIALSNSSLLLFLPACIGWMLWVNLRARNPPAQAGQRRRNRALARALGHALLACACTTAVVAPWIARNWRAFHAFVPMRSNFGAELYESADPLNQGFPNVATLPLAEAAPQLARYRRLGEIAYSREQGQRARLLIRAHPALFAAHAVKRVYFFWISVPHPADTAAAAFAEALRRLDYSFLSLAGLFGLALALHRRVPAATLFLAAFLLLPLIYYFITVQARFRHPLEPLIDVLAVLLFQSADRTRVWTRAARPLAP
ncbi:MAG: hypothetical protein M3O02_12850 [Acidobacteriota bacterium]|nr:hypothetical protein [Acidobacteriota bacterium]